MTTVSSIKTATNNKNYTVFIRDMDGCRNCHVHIYGVALITKIVFGEASLSNFVKVKVFIEQSKHYFSSVRCHILFCIRVSDIPQLRPVPLRRNSKNKRDSIDSCNLKSYGPQTTVILIVFEITLLLNLFDQSTSCV